MSNTVPGKGEEHASLLSYLLFWWVNPIVNLAYKQPLVQENLWPIHPKSHAGNLTQKFRKQWEAEMEKPQGQRSLAKATVRVFGWQLVVSGFLNLMQNAILLVTPVLIRRFLQWLESEDENLWKGYMYAGLLFLIGSLTNGIISAHMMQCLYKMGMDMRTVLNATIYQKSLNLSNSARQSTSTGEVVTLMSNDAERLPQAALTFHNIWITPLFLVAGIVMLIQLIGYAAIAGVLFLVISIPLQGKIALKQMKAVRKMMKITDKRVKLLNEILQGIKIVKFYAWEASFKERVTAVRSLELAQLKVYALWSALTIAILLSMHFVILLITFMVSAAIGESLEPDVVFTAVALLYIIRIPLFMLPMAIASIVNSSVSLKRMQRFLELEEISMDDYKWDNSSGTGKGHGCIEVKDGCFTWTTVKVDKEEEKSQRSNSHFKRTQQIHPAESREELLNESKDPEADRDISSPAAPFTMEVTQLQISGDELVAVVGAVGSGKSSLVSLMLGEMTTTKGEVRVNGSLAYVAQTAWIVNATVRENILMGRSFDEEKYATVIEACSLSHDLEMLPANDKTEIGEKGINLSGGQKQRISLARAAYADADIYLFDDPLSAVDAHVGRHIFERLLVDRLAGKTRVLCTNQLHFVPRSDRVLILKAGRITESGTYEELMSNEGEFSILMNTFEGKEEETNAEEAVAEAKIPKKEDHSVGNERKAAQRNNKLIEAEGKNTGSVKWQVLKTYLVEGTGGWTIPIVLLITIFLAQAVSNVYEWWLSYWTEAYLEDAETVKAKKHFYMYIYLGLGLASIGLTVARGLVLAWQGLVSSAHLHRILVAGIIRAPAVFFETTPTGRILNRFTKDMENIDMMLPRTIPICFFLFFRLLGTVITIIIVLPWFIIPVIPLAYVYFRIQKYYRPVARDLQRLESISRSPIFAQFSETLAGVSTLRAYNMQERFILQNEKRLDESNRSFYLVNTCNRWLNLRLELLGGFLSLLAAFILAASKSTGLIAINAGAAGLVMTYTLQITGSMTFFVQVLCQSESQITSAERIKEYSDLVHEAPEVIQEYRPPANWPTSGQIQINDLSMRYREGLDLVLQKVSLCVNGGEKVGIAGRTGSGKSSLMIALFRLVEPAEGSIFIDGVNTSELGLKDLRSALSIIPQDPVMFVGTLRNNLDPFQQYEDAVVWEALKSAHLYNFVSSNEDKLEMEISEGGENLSLGQRQLVCLARAILRRNKILVMDEATANIDMETDTLIQQTIRKEFQKCTVLTIAHRLHTIMDCNRIMIMDSGKLAEFDTPAALLENEGSILSCLVDETGSGSAKKLKEIALTNTDEDSVSLIGPNS